MELIILAGGFGKRIRVVENNLPKCLIDVNGTPFLTLLIKNWIKQGLKDFIFSLYYKSEKIIDFIEKERTNLFIGCKVRYVVEPKPLGTGGAVSFVINNLKINDSFLVTNSDTWIQSGIKEVIESRPPSILSVFINNVSRYGKLEINSKNYIQKFEVKDLKDKEGYINAGLYHLLKKNINLVLKESFSIESDLFPRLCLKNNLKAVIHNSKFIDIGIPEDYYKFCKLNTDNE